MDFLRDDYVKNVLEEKSTTRQGLIFAEIWSLHELSNTIGYRSFSNTISHRSTGASSTSRCARLRKMKWTILNSTNSEHLCTHQSYSFFSSDKLILFQNVLWTRAERRRTDIYVFHEHWQIDFGELGERDCCRSCLVADWFTHM